MGTGGYVKLHMGCQAGKGGGGGVGGGRGSAEDLSNGFFGCPEGGARKKSVRPHPKNLKLPSRPPPPPPPPRETVSEAPLLCL